jgi:hypothetical protein
MWDHRPEKVKTNPDLRVRFQIFRGWWGGIAVSISALGLADLRFRMKPGMNFLTMDLLARDSTRLMCKDNEFNSMSEQARKKLLIVFLKGTVTSLLLSLGPGILSFVLNKVLKHQPPLDQLPIRPYLHSAFLERYPPRRVPSTTSNPPLVG